jgi:hypothetical protein
MGRLFASFWGMIVQVVLFWQGVGIDPTQCPSISTQGKKRKKEKEKKTLTLSRCRGSSAG